MTIASSNAAQNNSFSQFSGDLGSNEWDSSGHQLALINDNAFAHATGNLGINVAAGNGNQQLNRAEILTDDSNGANSSTIVQFQSGASFSDSDDNTANIAQNAFANASGNIGVNVAAGNGNQQANLLTVIP
jgi:hypothetical protein